VEVRATTHPNDEYPIRDAGNPQFWILDLVLGDVGNGKNTEICSAWHKRSIKDLCLSFVQSSWDGEELAVVRTGFDVAQR
jgi:hypothetical protein